MVGVLAYTPNFYNRLSMRALALEWPMLHGALTISVGVTMANEPFRVEDSVLGIDGRCSRQSCQRDTPVGEGKHMKG